MGCYERDGAYYITCNPRTKAWPRLALRTAATTPEEAQVLHALLHDEIIAGRRLDLAMALKHGDITIERLAALVGENLKHVHSLTVKGLGLPTRALPRADGVGPLTFGDLVAAFGEERRTTNRNNPRKKSRRLSDDTVARYLHSYVCYARFLGDGDEDAGKLQPADILWDEHKLTQYGAARRDPAKAPKLGHVQRQDKVVSGSTVNRDLRALGALRAFGMRRYAKWFVGLNEPDSVIENEGDSNEHLLEPGDFEACLAYCDEQAMRPTPHSPALTQRDWVMFKYMLIVLYWTGARLSEMLRMKWDQWLLLEVEPVVLLEGHSELGPNHKRRLTSPPPLTLAMLEWKKIAEARGWRTDASAPAWGDEQPLLKKSTFSKAWNSVRTGLTARPNVRGHRIHDFRHDAAVGWIRAGASIEDVRQALGHKDRDVTYRYTKYQSGTMAEAGARRAAMEATRCADPLTAVMLTDGTRALQLLRLLVAKHPELASAIAAHEQSASRT